MTLLYQPSKENGTTRIAHCVDLSKLYHKITPNEIGRQNSLQIEPPYNTKSSAVAELFVYRNNPKWVIISWSFSNTV